MGPLSVAVLVDLHRTTRAGGHVKTWERLAEAAPACAGLLDLTVYVLGPAERVTPVAPNARFVSLAPVLSSGMLNRRLDRDTDSTDLAPYHPALARHLPAHDVWHVTHSFAFGRTAARLARRLGRPLVGAIQTDLPSFGRLYTRQFVERTLGRRAARLVADRLGCDRLAAAVLRRQCDRLLSRCEHVLVANETDRAYATRLLAPESVSRLRRGVDKARFHPGRRDRLRLARTYGVPMDCPVVLFAGRVDASKDALTVARAVRRLHGRAHLLVVGEGADAPAIRDLLGSGVTLPGALPQEELAWVYASCDVFAFPSRTDTIGNVVAEAMASGLPVLLQRGTSTTQWLAEPGYDGVLVPDPSPGAWTDALAALLDDPLGSAAMGRRARATIENVHPDWPDVLAEDLLPVWQQVSRRPLPVAVR